MQDFVNGRCGWCGTDELYVKYHDQEWGNLVTDDKTLFEFLVLESAQAGLSWITILKKREGYRKSNRPSQMQGYSSPYKRSSVVSMNIHCRSFPTESRLSIPFNP